MFLLFHLFAQLCFNFIKVNFARAPNKQMFCNTNGGRLDVVTFPSIFHDTHCFCEPGECWVSAQTSLWLAFAVILRRLMLSNEEFSGLGSVTKTLFLLKTSFLGSQTQIPELLSQRRYRTGRPWIFIPFTAALKFKYLTLGFFIFESCAFLQIIVRKQSSAC